jgi:epoxyqueuosine reductase
LQQWRQHFAQALGRGFVGQLKNGGNIGAMHDQNSTVDYAALKEKIREAGKNLGFAAIGVARAEPGQAVEGLRQWLAKAATARWIIWLAMPICVPSRNCCTREH